MPPWTPPAPGTPRPRAGTAQDAAAILRGHRVAVLTGAGVSTDSGLPDYRSPEAPPRHPITYQQFVGSPRIRSYYWARNFIGWKRATERTHNGAHRALARLEDAGVVTGLVTQNVDLFHESAGSHLVVDLHGRWDTVVCLHCGVRHGRDELDRRLERLNPDFEAMVGDIGNVEIAPDADAVLQTTEGFRARACWAVPSADGPAVGDNGFVEPGECGGMLKPDIVFFGENVPHERSEAAAAIVDNADVLLVVGTSLAVYSGLRLVRRAAQGHKPIVIVNRGGTRGDDLATLTVDGGAAPTLQQLVDVLVEVPHSS